MSGEKDFKFSAANWKIIEEFKEQKRKLKEFDASINHGHKDETVLKLVSPSQYMGSDTDSSSVSEIGKPIDVRRYCRASLCTVKDYTSPMKASVLSLERSLENYTPYESNVKEIKAKTTDEALLPQPLSTILECLFTIYQFKTFVTELSKILPTGNKKWQKYPTLKFFVEAVQQMHPVNRGDDLYRMTVSEDLSMSLQEEPSCSLLLGILEIMHEELVQAKQDGISLKVCMQNCRHTSKTNHTVISHLFRGQVKRKMICQCGHVECTNEAVTSVSLRMDCLEEKQIMLYFAGQNQELKLTTTRYLFVITSWTTVASLKEKLCVLFKRKRLAITSERLSVHMVKDNNVGHTVKDTCRLFDLLCEDGDIWVFDTSIGILEVDIDSLVNQSESTVHEERAATTSTPTTSDVSTIGQNISKLQNIRAEKKSNFVLVYVDVRFVRPITKHALVLRLPRISHGLHIMERIARVFGIGLSEKQSMILSIRTKTGHCLFCLGICCTGCSMQLSDKIVLSHQYTISVVIRDCRDQQLIKSKNDDSITYNCPVNISTLKEGFLDFLHRKDTSICPNCLHSDWSNVTTVFNNWPQVLIICFPNATMKTSQFYYSDDNCVFQDVYKSSCNTYALQALVTNDGDQLTYLKCEDSAAWFMKTGNEMERISMLPTTNIEMMFYVKKKKGVSYSHLSTRLHKRSKCMGKTKFSTHGGERRFGFTAKEYPCCSISHSINGKFTPRTCSPLSTDQRSHCNCVQCHTLDRMQKHITQSRSSSTIQSRSSNVSAVNCSKSSSGRRLDCSHTSHHSNHSSVWSSKVSFSHERKLHKAIREQDLKNVVKSLRDGADVNYILKGLAALHLCVAMTAPFGCVFTNLCLEYGADPNLVSADGMTPLQTAVMWGRDDTLKLLLRNGGLPTIKNANGKNAFDILLQSSNENSEYMLRLLRGEHGEEDMDKTYRGIKRIRHSFTGGFSLLNVSGDAINRAENRSNEVLGEQTFDEAFSPYLSTVDEENNVNCKSNTGSSKVSQLKESVFSQHFSDIDNSNPSFTGSHRFSWLSIFTCNGKFSKIRRRRNEERWLSRVVRRRIIKWFNDVFRHR